MRRGSAATRGASVLGSRVLRVPFPGGSGLGGPSTAAVSSARCADAATHVQPECGWAALVTQVRTWSVRRTQVGGVVSAGAQQSRPGKEGRALGPRLDFECLACPFTSWAHHRVPRDLGALSVNQAITGPPGVAARPAQPRPRGSRCGGGGEGREASQGAEWGYF